jgi:cytochrome c553
MAQTMRPSGRNKEMRYMRGRITDEEIEALAQYYANMPH